MMLLTAVQTPLEFGKKPVEQMRQVNGATVVAFTQFGKLTATHDVTPLLVWRPKPVAQLAQTLMEE